MSLPDDVPPPPLPAPPRDHLLDDPVFAEIVGPDAGAPLFAEPVETPAGEDLPVAEVVPPSPESLPKAIPIKARPKEPAPPPPSVRPSLPHVPDVHTEPPKAQWFAACSVIGCLGIAVIGSIALLAGIAIKILSNISDRVAEKKKDPTPTVVMRSGPPMGPISPPLIVSDTPIVLEGNVDGVGLGAGGRFLLLRESSRSQIELFDVNTATISHKIPLGEPKALFAAGLTKLFIFKPRAGMLQRLDLYTGQVEFEVPLAGLKLVDELAIGPGTDGPLYAIAAAPGAPIKVHVVDAATLIPTVFHELKTTFGRNDRLLHARASQDGKLLALAAAKGAVAFQFQGDKGGGLAIPLGSKFGTPPAFAIPSPDGQYLYTPHGVFDVLGNRLAGSSETPFATFPTAHGSGLFMSIPVEDGNVQGKPNLHAAGALTRSPLVKLTQGELEGNLPVNELSELALTPDDRVHLWPGAGVLAVLPIAKQQLQLFKVDVEAELKGASRDFIVFATDPPTRVAPGGEWSYLPKFWSRGAAKSTITIDGPKDMKLEQGKLTWTAPVVAGDPIEVVITAGTSPKATQKFRITVGE